MSDLAQTDRLFFDMTGMDRRRVEGVVGEALGDADDGELFLEYCQSESFAFDDGRGDMADLDPDVKLISLIGGRFALVLAAVDTGIRVGGPDAPRAALAAALRFSGLGFGLSPAGEGPVLHPLARPDEQFFWNLGLGIAAGDPNPHYFLTPSLFPYLLALADALYLAAASLASVSWGPPRSRLKIGTNGAERPAPTRMSSAISGIIW